MTQPTTRSSHKRTVGIVDYGTGNHASVRHSLLRLGLRCRASDDPNVLAACDLLVLPGVGAFRPAMRALHEKGLDTFLADWAARQRPLLGICLGMQLLTESSHEDGFSVGLALIPGETVPLNKPRWHIGWNTVRAHNTDPLFLPSDGQAFYFNHAYAYRGPDAFQVGQAEHGATVAAAIRRDRIVGVQFHPEKSQNAGLALLNNIVDGLCDAE